DDKASVMRKLLAIDREGLLPDLKLSFANDCRRAGTRSDAHWREVELRLQGFDTASVRNCAEFAADVFGKPQADFEAAAADAFMPDKWSDIGLSLINEYFDRISRPEPSIEVQLRPLSDRVPNAEDDATWEPIWGGPVNYAQQQREQKQREDAAQKKPQGR